MENNFSINQLKGKHVIVRTKKTDQIVTGELLLYGTHDKTIFLKNYTTKKIENEESTVEREGDLIIMKRDSWVTIEIPRM